MRLIQTFALFGSLILGSAAFCPADDPSSGYDSPESAVQAYAAAATVEDYPRLFSALTRESQVYHLALAVSSARRDVASAVQIVLTNCVHSIENNNGTGKLNFLTLYESQSRTDCEAFSET